MGTMKGMRLFWWKQINGTERLNPIEHLIQHPCFGRDGEKYSSPPGFLQVWEAGTWLPGMWCAKQKRSCGFPKSPPGYCEVWGHEDDSAISHTKAREQMRTMHRKHRQGRGVGGATPGKPEMGEWGPLWCFDQTKRCKSLSYKCSEDQRA